MAIRIQPEVREKLLRKHGVTEQEVRECFLNWNGIALQDDEEHFRDYPPSMWFVSETDEGRVLLVVYLEDLGDEWIVTVHEPGPHKIRVYERACEEDDNEQ